MISPLPRNKRAKNPRQVEGEHEDHADGDHAPEQHAPKNNQPQHPDTVEIDRGSKKDSSAPQKSGNFTNNPFEQIQTK